MEVLGWMLSIAIVIVVAVVIGLVGRHGKKTGDIVSQRKS